MKLFLATISLFLITHQNIDPEKEIPGKYVGQFSGEHVIIIKDNGKFVSKGYNLVPANKDEIPFPDNMPSPEQERKKRNYKSKGSWVYFEKDNLDGIILKYTNQIDSLFFLENGNLSPNNPIANHTTINTLNGDTIIISRRYTIKMPEEFVKE